LTAIDSVGTVIAELRKRGYSQIPILDKEKDEIIGIVQTKDVLKVHEEASMSRSVMRGIGDKNKDWYLLPAENFVTNALFTSGRESILNTIKFMIKHASHSLIVEDGEIRGIITAQDIISFFVEKQRIGGFRVIVNNSPNNVLKEHAINKGVSVMETFKLWLGAEAVLNIRFKRNKPSTNGSRFTITVQIRLSSIKGHIYATESTDYVVEIALNTALDRLYRIISQDKERTINRRIGREPHRYPVIKKDRNPH
jgi:CBS domain-containing protein